MLLIAEKKKMLKKGGIPDEQRVSKTILIDFRAGKIGNITLEKAEEIKGE